MFGCRVYCFLGLGFRVSGSGFIGFSGLGFIGLGVDRLQGYGLSIISPIIWVGPPPLIVVY